ncbi:unnamed protein product [Microthlaspi erraticum]|uniref:Uncharacterized protein n=1 Tax=Microthlaspi erraticum TaxID=1685480 RepID=A0A6D2IY06_9BRAS|nr:unnamed protein product [Microthlaspi erraticum]
MGRAWDDAFLVGRRGRADMQDIGWERVDHGAMLPGSTCALGLMYGRSIDGAGHGSTVGRCFPGRPTREVEARHRGQVVSLNSVEYNVFKLFPKLMLRYGTGLKLFS